MIELYTVVVLNVATGRTFQKIMYGLDEVDVLKQAKTRARNMKHAGVNYEILSAR